MQLAEIESRKQYLLETIHSKYPIENVPLELAGETFLLRLVSDTDTLLENLLALEETHEDILDERIPYWADLWHSAIGLAEHILLHPDIGADAEVLELGCGLGLSGIAAGKKKAKVTLSDYLPEALEMAELLWLENLNCPASCLQLDWRNIDPGLQFEWILAADVAYEERNFQPLIQAFKSLLSPGGKILLSEPGRLIARSFLAGLSSEGFSVKQFERVVTWRETTNKVGIYELSQT